jgi:peroxiredoxin
MKSLLLVAPTSVALIARAEEEHPTLALGSQAPDFDLPGVDERSWALNDFAQAKVLVVIFTCDRCPTAQYYEEPISRFRPSWCGGTQLDARRLSIGLNQIQP